MKIIIAPAKKMVVEEIIDYVSIPLMLSKTEKILDYLKSKSLKELQEIYKCNLDIASENYERFKTLDLDKNLSPAVFSYNGIQYKNISPNTMDDESLEWLQKNLRILSGFYGIVKPLDGITPYRLEFQSKLPGFINESLYDYFSDSIYKQLISEDRVILNLASEEYSKAISNFLTDKDRFVTCTFYELCDGKLKVKATLAKMARGAMVRYLAEIKADKIEDVVGFNSLGFKYHKELSTNNNYVFVLKTR